jgi:AcrR family transcriptional regulator
MNREQILDAALALVDREGIDALTVRRLASELGVGMMSLYYHVADKDALLEGVAERVLSDVEIPTSGGTRTPCR